MFTLVSRSLMDRKKENIPLGPTRVFDLYLLSDCADSASSLPQPLDRKTRGRTVEQLHTIVSAEIYCVRTLSPGVGDDNMVREREKDEVYSWQLRRNVCRANS